MLTAGAFGLALLASLASARTAALGDLGADAAAVEGYAWAVTVAATVYGDVAIVTAVGMRRRRLWGTTWKPGRHVARHRSLVRVEVGSAPTRRETSSEVTA